MPFRANVTYSLKEPPLATSANSQKLLTIKTSTCRTEESASNSHRGRSQLESFWVKAFLRVKGLLWWSNPPLPHRASRLMECKVPFNISTGVRHERRRGLLWMQSLVKLSIKAPFRRTAHIKYKAKKAYKSLTFWKCFKINGELFALIYRVSAGICTRMFIISFKPYSGVLNMRTILSALQKVVPVLEWSSNL